MKAPDVCAHCMRMLDSECSSADPFFDVTVSKAEIEHPPNASSNDRGRVKVFNTRMPQDGYKVLKINVFHKRAPYLGERSIIAATLTTQRYYATL